MLNFELLLKCELTLVASKRESKLRSNLDVGGDKISIGSESFLDQNLPASRLTQEEHRVAGTLSTNSLQVLSESMRCAEEYALGTSKLVRIKCASPTVFSLYNLSDRIHVAFKSDIIHPSTSSGQLQKKGSIAYKTPIFSDKFEYSYDNLILSVPISTIKKIFCNISDKIFPKLEGFNRGFEFESGDYALLFELANTISRIVAEKETPACISQSFEEAMVTRILFLLPQIADLIAGKPTGENSRLLRTAEQFLLQHVEKEVTLQDVVTAVNCSARSLQRIFHKSRGVGPMQVLTQMRLARAYEVIQHGAVTNVTELALSLHFSNPGRFAGLFKRHFGVSPAAVMRAKGSGAQRHAGP